MKFLQSGLRSLGSALLLATLASAGWFGWLVWDAARPSGPPPRADGIVALTGSADRVPTALRLLADGRAPVLLISGVGGAAAFAELAREAGVEPALAERVTARVTLGRSASSTHGNAREAAGWARAHDMRSLLLVTSFYHMPRALAELSRALPDVSILPWAVQPAPRGLAGARLLAGEYAKWVAVELDLSGYAEPPRGSAGEAEKRNRLPAGPPRNDGG